MDEPINVLKTPGVSLPRETIRFLEKTGLSGEKLGCRVYAVGGFIRDILLGAPSADIDITVEGDAEMLAQEIIKNRPGKIVSHRRFSTATVFFGDSARVDISTARKEKYPEPGSLPKVASSSIRDDLYRRDFTINALAARINPREFGELVDFFDGRRDLSDGIIRVLHDRSFEDDPTRILRALKFSARFGFRIEKNTGELLRSAAGRGFCGRVSPERLRNELRLLLGEEDPVPALKLMKRHEVDRCLHPCMLLDREKERSAARLKKTMEWMRDSFPDFEFEPWLAYLMALAAGEPPGLIQGLAERFNLSKKETRALFSVRELEETGRRAEAGKAGSRAGIYLAFRGKPAELLALYLSGCGRRKAKISLDAFISASSVRTHITGKDLLKMGIEPGPRFQRMLEKVLLAKIEGRVKSRREEMDFIMENMPHGGRR